jgi:hypothetical protein
LLMCAAWEAHAPRLVALKRPATKPLGVEELVIGA